VGPVQRRHYHRGTFAQRLREPKICRFGPSCDHLHAGLNGQSGCQLNEGLETQSASLVPPCHNGMRTAVAGTLIDQKSATVGAVSYYVNQRCLSQRGQFRHMAANLVGGVALKIMSQRRRRRKSMVVDGQNG
jgi:hypothetical protein